MNEPYGTFIDPRDDNEYKWVRIGDQIWMAENLRTLVFQNGDPIFRVRQNKYFEEKIAAYCDPCYLVRNGKAFGRLYNRFAVVDNRSIVPEGWCIPSNEDWLQLIDFLGGSAIAGGKLKFSGTDLWHEPNYGATNESGFSAVPAGFSVPGIARVPIGYTSIWWSSSVSEDQCQDTAGVEHNNSESYIDNSVDLGFYSVRCIKNKNRLQFS
jgi:uncharacterized protein (TIGR02145 family)